MGRNKKPRKWPLYMLFLAAAGLLVAGGVAIRYIRPSRQTARQQLISVGRAYVRQVINANLSSAFAGEEETTVEPLPENKFMISGWVDLITPEGRPTRRIFSCVVYQNSSGNWIGERISVIPQM